MGKEELETKLYEIRQEIYLGNYVEARKKITILISELEEMSPENLNL